MATAAGQAKIQSMIARVVLEPLERGDLPPWKKPWTATGAGPAEWPVSIHGRRYRGINALVLSFARAAEGYRSHVWVTAKQCKKQGGRLLPKQTPQVVFAWSWKERKVEDPATGEETTRRWASLFFYKVYNVDQTDGLNLPPRLRTPEPEAEPAESEFDPIEACEAVAAGYEGAPEVRHGCGAAWYRPSTDTVGMPDPEAFDEPASYYATLYHELGHSTGHPSRLDRKNGRAVVFEGKREYGQEELVAEFTACFLCAETGIAPKVEANAASYIDHWKRAIEADPSMVERAATLGHRAADWIMGRRGQESEA